MGETPTKKFEPAPHASGTPATKGEEFGASVDPIPFRLRTAMERAAMVLSNCASSRNRELDEGSQNLLRGVLDELDGACLEANLAVRPVTVEPVAEVYGVTKSFGEGDDERFYEGAAVRLLRDAPIGAKLYAGPVRA